MNKAIKRILSIFYKKKINYIIENISNSSPKANIIENELEEEISIQYPLVILPSKQIIPKFNKLTTRVDKGILENYFFDYLRSEFKLMISDLIEAEFGEIRRIPDLTYIDEKNRIFIAIEIDEPYTLNLNQEFIPTHYLKFDYNRNNLFISFGWIIIRFAEEQIAKNPNECIKYISSFINKETIIFPNLINIWTQEESLKMIKERYRNKYLPFEFKDDFRFDKISGNAYHSFLIKRIKDNNGIFNGNLSFIQKNGKRYVIILIESLKEQSNTIECWIESKIFEDKIKKTEFYKIILKVFQNLEPHLAYSIAGAFQKIRLEGYGKIEGNYFNLFDFTKFEIVCSDASIQKLEEKLSPIFKLNELDRMLQFTSIFPISEIE